MIMFEKSRTELNDTLIRYNVQNRCNTRAQEQDISR